MLFQSDLDQSFLKFVWTFVFKLTHYDPVAIAPGTDFTMLVDADVESRSQRWYGPTICVRTVSLSSLARTILAPDGRDSAILK